MKDINLNNTSDSNTPNVDISENTMDKENEIKTNETTSNKNGDYVEVTEEATGASSDVLNGNDETDDVNMVDSDVTKPGIGISEQKQDASVVLKHNYNEEQWSPLNPCGKKIYDIRLLKDIQSDPLSKIKPNFPLLETCNLLRTEHFHDTMMSLNINRSANDSLFPTFLKTMGPGNMRSPIIRDNRRDNRSSGPSVGRGSMKLNSPSRNSTGRNICISLREEVKLNESKDAWKPARLKKQNLSEEEMKTQELYKQFRGILNKLTPQKFDTLVEKVKSLEIDTQERLEGVIDLIFEKAIEEPKFSEAYAAMCNRLSTLKVPLKTSPDQCVNFRSMILTKCQHQFVLEKTDESVLKLEKEVAECNDAAKKKELQIQLEEAQRRVRMRSVGNVRFIGELYKLKMLTSKIMVYCMNYLIEKPQEEKLECLCNLLTTIGEQVESEAKEPLHIIINKMQDIVNDRKNKISSRVRFMIQDVIELRRRRWVAKNVIDMQPKMMDQIQKEAEQKQRHIELMNSSIGAGYRRDDNRRDDNRGGKKRGSEGRRQGNIMDNSWKTTATRTNYVVDTNKLKAMPQKNLTGIKLAPTVGVSAIWSKGSGTKSQIAAPIKNTYSLLENAQLDPATLRSNRDAPTAAYKQSKSIERSTFNTRNEFTPSDGDGATSIPLKSLPPTSKPKVPETTETSPPEPLPQEALPENLRKSLKQFIDLAILNLNDNELVEEVKLLGSQYQAAVVTDILNIALEKNAKVIDIMVKSLVRLTDLGIISGENLMLGMADIFEIGPDLYIDIPMLYTYLAKFIVPHIEKKNVTFNDILKPAESLVSAGHGHILLRAIISELKDSMGPTFARNRWQESGLELKQWMDADMVPNWISNNNLEFLEGSDNNASTDEKKPMSPSDMHSKLIQLMKTGESCDCIRGWVKDNIGQSIGEPWFLRGLTQAICEHAILATDGATRLNIERMKKYSPLIGEYADSQVEREVACLFGIQQLIHRLEHPQGLSLDIFQYLNEHYIISVDGFIAWETSEKEPEGKAVMLKALTSFFTSLQEGDNEDSGSET